MPQVKPKRTPVLDDLVKKPKRTRVPCLDDCMSTIARESNYWTSRFRGREQRDDLRQDGVIVALKVINDFDPTRGVRLTTYLTTALRRHFARRVREVLLNALDYTAEQRAAVRAHVRTQSTVKMSETTRLVMMRLRRLSTAQRALALDLAYAEGRIQTVAKRNKWTVLDTQRRVEHLRAQLRGRTGGETVNKSRLRAVAVAIVKHAGAFDMNA